MVTLTVGSVLGFDEVILIVVSVLGFDEVILTVVWSQYWALMR